MANSEEYWSNLSKKITDPVQTKNKRPDTSDLEIDFLTQYLNSDSEIMDIGSGSGLIVNKLISHVKSIIAVEKFKGFSDFISNDPNILVINADLDGFLIRKKFDSVLCFGVSQCFPKNEMIAIYKNIFEMVKEKGSLIVRMQCGINEDILVDGFSNELQTNYYANYRSVEHEKSILEEIGFTNIETFDIFPDTLNVWDNSRHYIFVCKK